MIVINGLDEKALDAAADVIKMRYTSDSADAKGVARYVVSEYFVELDRQHVLRHGERQEHAN